MTEPVAPVAHGTEPEPAPPPVVVDGKIAWTAFDERALEDALESDRPVFVFFTADWCATCQALDKTVLETDRVHRALESSGALPMLADLTNENERSEAWLARLGRDTVPLCAVLLPDGRREVLPEIPTIDAVTAALGRSSTK